MDRVVAQSRTVQRFDDPHASCNATRPFEARCADESMLPTVERVVCLEQSRWLDSLKMDVVDWTALTTFQFSLTIESLILVFVLKKKKKKEKKKKKVNEARDA